MIFVTVGTQLPFPRLIDSVDKIAPGLAEPVFAQTLSKRHWAGIETVPKLLEEAFDERCRAARCLVGHAGIGTYLAACRYKKPVILMPRRVGLNEHRTDHQMDTATALAERQGVQIVQNAGELRDALAKAEDPAGQAPVGYETLLSELAEIAGRIERAKGLRQPNIPASTTSPARHP